MLVLVCRGPECGDQRNSAAVHRALVGALPGRVPVGTEVVLRWQSCFGQCQKGPNVLVREMREKEDALLLAFMPTAGEGAALYLAVRPQDTLRIIDEHIVGGRTIDEFKRRG